MLSGLGEALRTDGRYYLRAKFGFTNVNRESRSRSLCSQASAEPVVSFG